MIDINCKFATIAMVACLLSSVTAIAAEKHVTSTKVNSYSVTKAATKEYSSVRTIPATGRDKLHETTKNYELYDGSVVEERVLRRKGTFSENLERLFSALDISALPSGILLETGGLFELGAIQQRNGRAKDEGRDKDISLTFGDMYGGLARAAEARGNIPSLRKVQQLSEENFEKHNALPLAISIVNYERVDPKAIEDGRLIVRGGKLHNRGKGTYWQSSTFIDAGMVSFSPKMCGLSQMVMPSDMFLSNVDDKGRTISLESATISFDGSDVSIDVKPDKPFAVPIGALLDEKLTLDIGVVVNTSGGSYNFQTSWNLQACLDPYMTGGVQFDEKISLIPLEPAPHCDLPPTVAIHPYSNGLGAVVPRVYPASGETAECNQLNRVLVLLDGIDLKNNRGPATLWGAFGVDINYFLSQGYDVITLNYVEGNTFVQRNGEALRTFMVHTLPTLMDVNPATTDVALLAGSMGGQVANYGLRHAEMANEEHNTRLFMTLDTEYDGANVPTGLQLVLQFFQNNFGFIPEMANLATPLGSPAARQLLRHNITSSTGLYSADPLFSQLKAEIGTLGLPTTSRNVAIANGSGTGHVYAAGLSTNLSNMDINLPGVLQVYINANTDHQGQIFRGKITLFNESLSDYTVSIGSGALQDDVQPGSSRPTPAEIAAPFNKLVAGFPGISPLVTYGTATHSFVPTASALGTGFDFTFYEKCNTGHGTITVGNKEVISKEMIAFKNGVLPVHALPYSQACDQPEPVACSRSVFWWDQTFISPTVYGPFCKIADIPDGETAFTSGQNYYLEKAEPCGYPYSPDFNTGKCRIATKPDNAPFDAATATIKVYVNDPTDPSTSDQSSWNGPNEFRPNVMNGWGTYSICPQHNSDYIEVSNNYPSNQYYPWTADLYAVCKLKMSQYDSPADVELVGNKFFLIQDDLCPVGTLDVFGCWMGEAPVGVTPVLSGNKFSYSE